MSTDIYSPHTMIAALKQVTPPKRFFMETFFKNIVTHTTETVELDIYKGNNRIAALVNPIHDGVIVEREGFTTSITRPAYTKEKTAIRPTDTRSRAIGENIYNASTPEQRAAQLLGEDLAMLEERLQRREEVMCAEAITTGKVTVKGKGWDAQVDFGYENGKHIKILTGGSCWDKDTSDPLHDIDKERREVAKRCGITPTYCIAGYKAAWALTNNKKVRETLDNTRMHMGVIAPGPVAPGVTSFGILQLPSGTVNLLSYDEWYTDPASGESKPLVPEDMIILGSPEARCEMNYGLIQNMHSLQAVPRFPHSWLEDDGSARWVQLESAPMPNLYQVDAFTVMRVLSV